MTEDRKQRTGTVYLVGAGPGDPELITRRGARLLAQADCVIYDRLVSPKLLKATQPGCEKIYVGKGSDEGGQAQTEINRLLVRKARRYRLVIRLKGGDPFVFGRAAEELETLVREKIPFEVVPGVSSVWAAAAAAGIPLTDRRFSSSVGLVAGQRAVVGHPLAEATGQEALGKEPSVDWGGLSRAVDTLVILMGRGALPKIVQRLRHAGKPASTPIALIRSASTPDEQILISTLGKVVKELGSHPDFAPPVVVVIGEVVRLSKKFRPRPLMGKRILTTRPAADQAGLSHRLETLGAQCVSLPTIEIRPHFLPQKEAKALLERLPSFDWILFTSRHGVEGLNRLARRFGKDLPRLSQGKICAIGPRTLETARRVGLKGAFVPEEFSKEGIAEIFRRISVRGKRILIPRSNLGRGDSLAKNLRRRGAYVEEVVLYETVPVKLAPQRVRRAVHRLDAATFTSASTVQSFLKALEQAGLSVRETLNGAKVVAIGPETAQALKKAGVNRCSLPKKSWTIDGLVEAVVEAVNQEGSNP